MELLLFFNNNNSDRESEFPTITVGGIITPERSVAEGMLVKSYGAMWLEIAKRLGKNWNEARQLTSRQWEEMIAGAFHKEGYRVTLTPRSSDHGRDVIAETSGVGCLRILGSVKAYAPDHRVTKEEVHALMGVVSADPSASKGILTTTSDFAPKILEDANLARAVPNRIELINGKDLQTWLTKLSEEK